MEKVLRSCADQTLSSRRVLRSVESSLNSKGSTSGITPEATNCLQNGCATILSMVLTTGAPLTFTEMRPMCHQGLARCDALH
jgi:hypothetical protein